MTSTTDWPIHNLMCGRVANAYHGAAIGLFDDLFGIVFFGSAHQSHPLRPSLRPLLFYSFPVCSASSSFAQTKTTNYKLHSSNMYSLLQLPHFSEFLIKTLARFYRFFKSFVEFGPLLKKDIYSKTYSITEKSQAEFMTS